MPINTKFKLLLVLYGILSLACFLGLLLINIHFLIHKINYYRHIIQFLKSLLLIGEPNFKTEIDKNLRKRFLLTTKLRNTLLQETKNINETLKFLP